MTRFENPNSDWPRVRRPEGGGIRISGTFMPPHRAGAVSALFGLIVFAQCALVLAGTGNVVAAAVWGALMSLLYPVLWKQAFINLLGKIVDATVFPDRIEVSHGFLRKKYCRTHPITFRIEPHHKGFDEVFREMKTGRKQKSTYRLAVEVVMQYGERRIVIAEMPLADTAHAEALLARLRGAMKETEVRAKVAAISVPAQPARVQFCYSPYSSAAHL